MDANLKVKVILEIFIEMNPIKQVSNFMFGLFF